MEYKTYLLNDLAITSDKEDIFNFSHYAKKVNKILQRNSSDPETITVGIYGKWGEGKTSFMNLLESYLSVFEEGNLDDKRILKYHFNPWRYSTEDEMLFDFFEGLSRTLMIEKNENIKKAGKYILQFSRYLKAIKLSASVGIPGNLKTITFEPSEIFKALGEDLIGKDISLEKLKEKIDNTLKLSNYKIAIFIDDIDRLDKDEIYTLLKIVKLNANFKNLIYIISLDAQQVSKAIHHRYGNKPEDGYLFLEKIINIPIYLPRIEKEDLQYFFEKKLSIIKSSLALVNKEEDFKKIIFTFNSYNFDSPRKIIRILNSFFVSALSIGEEVNLEDLFGIEYIKIINENCYQEIKRFQDNSVFNSFKDIIDFNITDDKSGQSSGFRKELLEKYPNTNSIITKLFPEYNQNWQQETHHFNPNKLKKELRINTIDHFDKYFTYHTLRKIPEKQIDELIELILLNEEGEAIAIINHLFETLDTHKVIFRLERLLSDIADADKKAKTLLFFAKQVELIPDIGKDMFGQNFQSRFIEKIATIFNEDESNIQQTILTAASSLDTTSLCYFTRKFNEEKAVKKDLYKMIVDRVKQERNIFFEVPENMQNKMIMFAWKKSNPQEFSDYIKSTLNANNVDLLVRNFPSFWNNTYFGGLSRSNYDFMKSIIDVDFIYVIIKEKYPEKINHIYTQEELLNTSMSDMDRSTIEQNIDQFIYWYKLDEMKAEDGN